MLKNYARDLERLGLPKPKLRDLKHQLITDKHFALKLEEAKTKRVPLTKLLPPQIPADPEMP
jgi:3-methyladenine DNA glycosylase AlkD